MSERTARDFMQVSDKFGGKSAIIADLRPTILYALAAPSTPETMQLFDPLEKTASRLADAATAVNNVSEISDLENSIGRNEQQAMATALAYPEPTNKGGRGKKAETAVLNTDVSSAYLKHARFVLRHCRDKAEAGFECIESEDRAVNFNRSVPQAIDFMTIGLMILAKN